MGDIFEIKCVACNYGISVTRGVGMAYSPHAVFYGRCDDATQNWSIAFPDGYCEKDKPLLLSLVKSKRIKDIAFNLIANGAQPDHEYGHDLYSCPKCNRLANRFYFKLVSPTEQYEPDYHCSNCKTLLQRAELKRDENGKREIIYINYHESIWKCPECGCKEIVLCGVLRMWD